MKNMTEIAKQVRQYIKETGGVFGVRVNRQWEKRKTDACTLLYVEGAYSFCDDAPEKGKALEVYMSELAENEGLVVVTSSFNRVWVKRELGGASL
ncbi:hypothetical protein [Bacillus phage CP-51]|uniref:Uncharacterized protein n=1 Tax=Bacillus phage CP-51 TaxID=1391188 RepID=A0A068EMI9_9CAUD|nr:hypothetical protein OZ73_gp173 [Bacillus phage CP-51]AID50608.1 hypothetical protein [Bacillus phage CP-51]